MQRMTGEKGEIVLSAGEDSSIFEERLDIQVKEGRGKITANRPRALLLGVYEFLRRCGCRFIRPGADGEVIPKKVLSQINVSAEISPKNHHRGITIEGAVSLENVLEIVKWAPKVGFNSYFLQFRTAYEFFNRWYSHARNEKLAPQPFSEKVSEAYFARVVQAIKERDMIYHAVGHGWTAALIGADGNGWKKTNVCLSENKRSLLAQVNGKRDLFEGIPLNTQLCYSDPRVRSDLADEVLQYVIAHPEIDVLHVWLADNYNNVCECNKCARKSISDWYILLLNEIDMLLTEHNLPVKICFLVYLDLFWPPKTERIINQGRFIMMFAPIFRTYTKSYDEETKYPRLEYRKNKMRYPTNAGTYLYFLREWQKIFQGDSFDFDYHLMWDIIRDFGGEKISNVLMRDIRSLSGLGLNGFMSCQLQRAFYPNGLAFYILGRALFDENVNFETLREEYYTAAFGKNAEFAKEFYLSIEQYIPFAYMREEEKAEEALPKLEKAQGYLHAFLSKEISEAEDGTRRESMKILRFMAENAVRFINVLVLKLRGAPEEEIRKADKERKNYFNVNELRFQPYADGFYINMILDGIIETKKMEIYV